ncbi:efflux RND transporter periplasmic adaptor subunit [Shewanella sp. Scap07]|uniref:efflux RND transporter periplasmic adaptor subunit n=1 Tax=Shewanella sp. Scap07 TaxID=2589987 RepID=UPI00211756F9|nr:efflux RND transporter periplasmic adaptor subunit [Shewanella sp. Scap07]
MSLLNLSRPLVTYLVGLTLFFTPHMSMANGHQHEQHQHQQAQSAPSDAHYYCPMHPEVTGDKDDRCPKCNMFLVSDQADTHQHTDEVKYYCPMHPEVTGDKDDRCPKCNMFLVSDQADTHQHTNEAKYYCPMHPEVTSHEAGRCPKCNMFLVSKEEEEETDAEPQSVLDQPKPTLVASNDNSSNIKYVCPMHPHVISDEPGSCPICGMDLEQVSTSGQAGEEVVVGVNGGMQQALGMRSETVERGTLWKLVKTIGTVEYNENAIGHVHTRVTGWIETLHVHNVGQRVKKGELLYELYSPELVNAQDDYMQAKDYLKQDKNRGNVLLKKARQRLELLGVNDATIKQLERTGETIYRVPFYADQDGFVSQLTVRHGMYVQPGDTLIEIVDLSSVWVIADVFENEQSWLEQGRPVEITSSAQGLFDLESSIDYIYPELDPVTRAMRVRIKLDNPNKMLKPGTLVDVKLFGGPSRGVLSVPTEALILTGRENRVVVQRDDTRFASVPVKVGIITQGHAEIIEGLNEGDKVIVSGQFLLDSEASIQGTLQRLSGSNSQAPESDPHAHH